MSNHEEAKEPQTQPLVECDPSDPQSNEELDAIPDWEIAPPSHEELFPPLTETDKTIFLLEDAFEFRGILVNGVTDRPDWNTIKDRISKYCLERLNLGSKEIKDVIQHLSTRSTLVTGEPHNLPIISGPELSQIEFPPRRFLMEGYIREGGAQHAFAGPPKEGKSSFLTEEVRSIATGEDFLGFKCAGVPVLYLCNEEDLYAIKDRFAKHNALSDSNIKILSQPGRIWDDLLKAQLSKAVALYKIKLLVIDTFNNTFDFENENDNAEMKKIVNDARLWGYQNSCSTQINLHTVKNGSRDLDSRLNIRNVRGAGAIVGLTDVITMFAKANPNSDTNTERVLSLEGRIERRTHMHVEYDFPTGRYEKVKGGEKLLDYFLRKKAEEEAGAARNAVSNIQPQELPFEPDNGDLKRLLSHLVNGGEYYSQKELCEDFKLDKSVVSRLLRRLDGSPGWRQVKRNGKNKFIKQ